MVQSCILHILLIDSESVMLDQALDYLSGFSLGFKNDETSGKWFVRFTMESKSDSLAETLKNIQRDKYVFTSSQVQVL